MDAVDPDLVDAAEAAVRDVPGSTSGQDSSFGRSQPPITGGGQGADDVAQRRHTRQACRGDIDAAGKRRALSGDTERVDAIDEDGGRTNEPSILRLLLTGNHGGADPVSY